MGLTENKRIQHVVATTAAISADDFDGRLAYDTTEQAIRVRAGGVAKYASMRGHTHVKSDVVDTTSDINLLDYIPSNLHTAIRSYSSTTDVAAYVQQAIDDAYSRSVGVYVPGGRYYIRSTINIKCARFYGSTYPQSATGLTGNPGPEFRFDPPAGWTDLTAALECSHANGVVEGISAFGGASWAIASMATWCNAAALPNYSAFSAGLAMFRTVGTAKTVFRRIKTGGKVGLLIDSTDGHVTVYDSTLTGMFGVYQRISSGDMFFQGCGINGTFAGIIFGDLEFAGHYGGMDATIFRCHMGFSPWGIYQVRDNATPINPPTRVSGFSGHIIGTSWEQVGECAIEMLPNSDSNFDFVGGTQGWASIAGFRVPSAIRAERMKYWFRFGGIEYFNATWALQSSGREFFIPSPYADNLATAKACYIDKLGARAVRCNWNTMNGSVDIGSGGVDREAGDPRYWRGWRVTKEETEQVQASVSPVSNLINNPEVAANWTPNGDAGSGPSITTGAWSSFAELASYAPPVQMVEELGPDPIVTKFVAGTGAGVDCGATINLIAGAQVSGRRKFFSYWGICPGATQRNIRTSLVDAGAAKIMDVGRATGLTDWVKHEAYDGSPTHISTQFALGFHNAAAQPTFVAGIMVSVGRTRPYTPNGVSLQSDSSGISVAVGGISAPYTTLGRSPIVTTATSSFSTVSRFDRPSNASGKKSTGLSFGNNSIGFIHLYDDLSTIYADATLDLTTKAWQAYDFVATSLSGAFPTLRPIFVDTNGKLVTGTRTVTREMVIQALPITNAAPGVVTLGPSGSMRSFGFDGGTQTEELFYHIDLQHDYVAGTDVIAHVHWVPSTNGSGNVVFKFDYQWVNGGDPWPAPTTVTCPAVAAGGTAWVDKRSEVTISGAGKTYASRLVLRLYRDPTDPNDTYAADAVLSSIGVHYTADPMQVG